LKTNKMHRSVKSVTERAYSGPDVTMSPEEPRHRGLGYGLDDRASILGRSRDFSLCHHVQTDSGVHLASCARGTGGRAARA